MENKEEKIDVYLRKVTLDMGEPEYSMYQEIPREETGAENFANGLSFEEFQNFLVEQIKEEFSELNEETTPKINYIMYVDDYPIGDIAIRPGLNDYWKKYSGNIGYKIRPSERKKGYGKLMLKLALDECKKIGLDEILLQCNNKNIASRKIIERNGGILIKEDGNTLRYVIKI